MITRKQRNTTPHVCYVIEAGTPCQARKAGDDQWLAHATKLRRVFAELASQDKTHLTFQLDGWLMRVERCHVVLVGPDAG